MENMHIFLFNEQKVLLANADNYTGVNVSKFIDENEAFTAVREALIREGKVLENDDWTCFS